MVHKNCVSVDNRLENLMLVPEALGHRWCQHYSGGAKSTPDNVSSVMSSGNVTVKDADAVLKPAETNPEQSLYYIAIQQLPQEPFEEVSLLTVFICKQKF